MTDRELTSQEINFLLEEFCKRAKEFGITGVISIVGGAAMLLAYNEDRPSTTDVDALLPNHPQITRIIAQIASENGLTYEWLNGHVEEFVPFGVEDAWKNYKEIHGITVRIATAELLLAMKLTAGRPAKDYVDIETLIDLVQLQSIDEAMALLNKFRITRPVKDATWDFVQKVLIRNAEEDAEDYATIDEHHKRIQKLRDGNPGRSEDEIWELLRNDPEHGFVEWNSIQLDED